MKDLCEQEINYLTSQNQISDIDYDEDQQGVHQSFVEDIDLPNLACDTNDFFSRDEQDCSGIIFRQEQQFQVENRDNDDFLYPRNQQEQQINQEYLESNQKNSEDNNYLNIMNNNPDYNINLNQLNNIYPQNDEDQYNNENQALYYQPQNNNFSQELNYQQQHGSTQLSSEYNCTYQSMLTGSYDGSINNQRQSSSDCFQNCYVGQTTQSSSHGNAEQNKTLSSDSENILQNIEIQEKIQSKQQSNQVKQTQRLQNQNQESSNISYDSSLNTNIEQDNLNIEIIHQMDDVSQTDQSAQRANNNNKRPTQRMKQNDKSKIKNHYRNFSKRLNVYVRNINENHWGIKKIRPLFEKELKSLGMTINDFIKKFIKKYSNLEFINSAQFRKQYTIQPNLPEEEKLLDLWFREFTFQFFQEEVYIYIFKDNMRIPKDQIRQYLSICSKYLMNIINPSDNFMDIKVKDCMKLIQQFYKE